MERDPTLKGIDVRAAARQRLLSNIRVLEEINTTGDSTIFGEIFRKYNKLVELSLSRRLTDEELIRTRHLEAQINGDLGPAGITQIYDHWREVQIQRQNPQSPFEE